MPLISSIIETKSQLYSLTTGSAGGLGKYLVPLKRGQLPFYPAAFFLFFFLFLDHFFVYLPDCLCIILLPRSVFHIYHDILDIGQIS